MKGEVLTVIVLLLKIYLCEAENVIVGTTKQCFCQIKNGNLWEKFNYGSSFWEIIYNGGKYSGAYSSTLTITNFQIEDSGYLRCKEHGTDLNGGNIQLNPEIQASIGSLVTLTCTVPGALLYWYVIGKNGAQTVQDDGAYEDSRTNSLKIKYLTTNTAAVYYCLPLDRTRGPDITVSIAGWSSWNEWSACSVSCGDGQHQRSRTCLGGNCEGSVIENEECTVHHGVDGNWSTWSTSGTCTVSCGSGAQSRIRRCNNPPPANCGEYCIGDDNDFIFCSLIECPVDGRWSAWDSWGACTFTCGSGQQSRSRACNNPTPKNNGAYCAGQGVEYNSCTLPGCPVDGGWSSWGSWGACTVTCGIGQQSRRRYCNNPVPEIIGAYCPGEKYDYNSCTLPACPEKQSGNTPIVVGTVIGVLVIVILILILVIYAKRTWYKSKKEPDYEITDMTKVKSHIYGKTRVNHAYQNEQQSEEVDVSYTENQYTNEAHLVERYDVSELTKRCQNKEYFLQSVKAEFRLLNNSTDDPKPFNSQYEIVNTGLRQDVNQLHLDSSTLDVLYTDNVSILLEPPQKDIAEQFWTIVDNQCVENIILLAKGNEKMSEFYPMLDDIMRINNFEIYLDSAERMNKHIMLLTFNLQNKTTQSIRQIRIFKTNVSEYPSVQILCFVMDKASEIRGVPVLIINSEMADLSVCGVLTVCLNAIYAIKNGSLFSILENATMANKNNSSFFKNFDDYELCYRVLGNYLEAVHTYDFIE